MAISRAIEVFLIIFITVMLWSPPTFPDSTPDKWEETSIEKEFVKRSYDFHCVHDLNTWAFCMESLGKYFRDSSNKALLIPATNPLSLDQFNLNSVKMADLVKEFLPNDRKDSFEDQAFLEKSFSVKDFIKHNRKGQFLFYSQAPKLDGMQFVVFDRDKFEQVANTSEKLVILRFLFVKMWRKAIANEEYRQALSHSNNSKLALARRNEINPAFIDNSPKKEPADSGFGLANIDINSAVDYLWKVNNLSENRTLEVDMLVEIGNSFLVADRGDNSYMMLPNDLSAQFVNRQEKVTGIGTQLSYKDEKVTVKVAFPGLIAQKSGIKEDDIITQVKAAKEKSVAYRNNFEIKKFFLSEGQIQDNEIEITYKRDKQTFVKKILVDQYKKPRFYTTLINLNGRKISYVRLFKFAGRDTANRIFFMLYRMWERDQSEGVILDLRKNGGGIRSLAKNLASLFLKDGTPIATFDKIRDGILDEPVRASKDFIRVTSGKRPQFMERLDQRTGSYPLTVLVDRYSASASEAVTQALKDNGRAYILGEVTLGKGTEQEGFENYLNSYFQENIVAFYNTSCFYGPNGCSNHHQGVRPTYLMRKRAGNSFRSKPISTDYRYNPIIPEFKNSKKSSPPPNLITDCLVDYYDKVEIKEETLDNSDYQLKSGIALNLCQIWYQSLSSEARRNADLKAKLWDEK